MQYLKFFFLMILDLFFSAGTSYFILIKWSNKISKNSSCGTGSLGEALFAWILVGIIFIALLGIYGFLFYWILFTLL